MALRKKIKILLIRTRVSDSSIIVIMYFCQKELTLATGRRVHWVVGVCPQQMCSIAPLNTQYHQFIQATLLRREILRCRPQQRAKAVVSIRVGNRLGGRAYLQEVRHGGRANRQEVITSVISRPLRVPSPANRQTGYVGVYPRYAIQTDRVATGGERWRSKHPPPWPHQSAGKVPTNPT